MAAKKKASGGLQIFTHPIHKSKTAINLANAEVVSDGAAPGEYFVQIGGVRHVIHSDLKLEDLVASAAPGDEA